MTCADRPALGGFERLSGIIEQELGRVARSGALFVFLGKHRGAVKVVFCDGSGMRLFTKRLGSGTFLTPLKASADGRVGELAKPSLMRCSTRAMLKRRQRPWSVPLPYSHCAEANG